MRRPPCSLAINTQIERLSNSIKTAKQVSSEREYDRHLGLQAMVGRNKCPAFVRIKELEKVVVRNEKRL